MINFKNSLNVFCKAVSCAIAAAFLSTNTLSAAPRSLFSNSTLAPRGGIDEGKKAEIYNAILRKEVRKEFGVGIEDVPFLNLKAAVEKKEFQIPQVRFEVRNESILAVLPGNDAVFVLNNGNVNGKTTLSTVAGLSAIKASVNSLISEVALLTARLKDPEWRVRTAAVSGVASVYVKLIDEGKAVDLMLLTALLKDPYADVRNATASAMTSVYVKLIEEGKEVDIALLTALLKDPDWTVREAVLPVVTSVYRKLIEKGKKIDLSLLTEMLKDPNGSLRRAAGPAVLSVYGTLIENGKEEYLALCAAILKDPKWVALADAAPVVASVYTKLIKKGKKVDLQPLIALLKNQDMFVLAAAAPAVASVYVKLIEEGKEVDLAPLTAILRGSSGFVRAAAIPAVASVYVKLIEEGKEVDLSSLTEMLKNPDRDVLGAAAPALASVYVKLIEEGKEVDFASLTEMLKNPDMDVSGAVVPAVASVYVALIKKGKKADLVSLTRMLESPDGVVRRAVALVAASVYVTLIEEGKEVNIASLTVLLKDPDVRVSCAVFPGVASVYVKLIEQGKDVDLALLTDRLKDLNMEVRAAAAPAVASMYVKLIEQGKEVDLTILTALLKDLDMEVRTSAASAVASVYVKLIESGKAVDLTLLTALLKDPKGDVRAAAAPGVASMYVKLIEQGKEEYLALLTAMLKDLGPVRRAAAPAVASVYVKLIEAGNEEYLVSLTALLEHPEWYVRAAAVSGVASVSVIKTDQLILRYGALIEKERTANIFSDYLVMASITEGKSFVLEYETFLNDFRSVNEKLAEDRRLNEGSFFAEHQACVTSLAEIMGVDSFRFLKGFIASDPYPLKRFFDAFDPSVLSSEVVKSLREFYRTGKKKDFSSLQKIFEILPAYAGVGKTGSLLERLQSGKNDSWPQVYTDLAKTYLKELAKSLEIDVEKIDPSVFDRFPKKYLPRLNVSMAFIKKEHSGKVGLYRSLLKAAFEGRFADFMVDTAQADEEGKALAEHNKQVREKIKTAGVDEKVWLGYVKETPFNFSDRNLTVDPEDEIVRLTQLLATLKTKLTGPNQKYQGALDNALSKLNIKLAGGTDEKMPARCISGGKEVRDREKVVAAFKDVQFLEQLKKTLGFVQSKTQGDVAVQEALGHVNETIGLLTQLLLNPDILKELAKKRQNFTIRMWKRDPAHDLFMGDFTGCCMASNSNQHFEAMIDHLIDQGIQVAEVIDEDTGETMALAWLFLAVDDKGNPHVVIDNIEINDDYARIQPLKEQVKEQLISYAEDFGRAAGAASLLAGMFGYSKMKIDEYTVEKRELEKLGGYLDPDSPYYLEALEKKCYGDVHVLVKDLQKARPAEKKAIEPKARTMVEEAA